MQKRIYIKVSSLSDTRINAIYRIAALNRGEAQVVLYDESTGKYSAMKDILVIPSERVLTRLRSLFSDGAVVLK